MDTLETLAFSIGWMMKYKRAKQMITMKDHERLAKKIKHKVCGRTDPELKGLIHLMKSTYPCPLLLLLLLTTNKQKTVGKNDYF